LLKKKKQDSSWTAAPAEEEYFMMNITPEFTTLLIMAGLSSHHPVPLS
jgi:hypothetical protein